jgi:hypothetical protein
MPAEGEMKMYGAKPVIYQQSAVSCLGGGFFNGNGLGWRRITLKKIT